MVRGRDSSSLGSRIRKGALGGGGRSVALMDIDDCGAGLVEARSSGCAVDPRLDLDVDLDVDLVLECDRIKGENVHRRFWRGLLNEGEGTEACCGEDDDGGGGKEGEGVGDALARGEVEGEGDDRWT